ncbi:hypothetical protein HNR27_001241 [Ornithinibacillus bavariensis]
MWIFLVIAWILLLYHLSTMRQQNASIIKQNKELISILEEIRDK